MSARPIFKALYFQVVLGIVLGVALGYLSPHTGAAMRPLGDGFIKLIRMLIAPVVFTTVAVGIAQMGAMKAVGRIGLRALVYFEVVSSLALVIGLAVVMLLKPGVGLGIASTATDTSALSTYTSASQQLGVTAFLLNIIPTTLVDAFAKGDILQVLLISVLFGLVLLQLGERVRPLVQLIDQLAKALFGIVEMIMHLAPIGAFGAMAFTVGHYGIGTLMSLGKLMIGVYVTCLFFVFVVLGAIARSAGFSLWRLLNYLKDEILIVLGTASSESVLPRVMEKLETLGCPKPVVGLVVPMGYSFNLDGTSIYMSMAVVFVAEASGVHLSLGQEASILGILLLTSKGAAAVSGAGFVTLAATLSTIPSIPVAGLAVLLGVDRFMSEARAITNLIGNAVATLMVAKWEGTLDMPVLRSTLGTPAINDPAEAVAVLPDATYADPRP